MFKEELLNTLNTSINTLAIKIFDNMIRERKLLYNPEYLMSIIKVIIPEVKEVSYDPIIVKVNDFMFRFNGECFVYEESDTLSGR